MFKNEIRVDTDTSLEQIFDDFQKIINMTL